LWAAPTAFAAQDSDSPYAAAGGEPAARTLYLVRHGQYDIDDPADSEIGRALVPLGVAQARLTAARLKALPVAVTSLHTSTMTRARETAAVIAAALPPLMPRPSRLLRECTPPTWREDVMEAEDPAELAACQGQLEEAFTRYFVPARGREAHDVVVCHGNVIRYFVCKVLDVDTLAWLQMSIANCSVTVVVVRPDGSFKLVAFGDAGHLPPSLQTYPGGDRKELVVPTR
jgi:serine/threonine-protein phosphatase PGAM5